MTSIMSSVLRPSVRWRWNYDETSSTRTESYSKVGRRARRTKGSQPEKEEKNSRRSDEIKFTTDDHVDIVSKFLWRDTFSCTSTAKSETDGYSETTLETRYLPSRVRFEFWLGSSRSTQQDEVARIHLKRINLGGVNNDLHLVHLRIWRGGHCGDRWDLQTQERTETTHACSIRTRMSRRKGNTRWCLSSGSVNPTLVRGYASNDNRCKSEPVTAVLISKAGAAPPPISDGLARTREGRAVLACSQKCSRSVFQQIVECDFSTTLDVRRRSILLGYGSRTQPELLRWTLNFSVNTRCLYRRQTRRKAHISGWRKTAPLRHGTVDEIAGFMMKMHCRIVVHNSMYLP
ncbi:hypothetical protein IW261DRAFT_1626282 [Armillaria novae-zelandiae]|uniref:Uncharacterized protein n=1 Tax=Armillaria novae-zelandiae TaxID=153914 RepID=A0AA39P7P9_9AGAR|nr:hypothetical protein IW261DRAFT_1626282 [Armillaria novae-zelandiae]